MPQYAALIYDRDADWTQPEYADELKEYGEFGEAAATVLRRRRFVLPLCPADRADWEWRDRLSTWSYVLAAGGTYVAGPVVGYLAWDEPNTDKVLFAHWVEDDSTIVSESRIKPIGKRASAQTRVLWAAVGQFERFIGREALRAAARSASSR